MKIDVSEKQILEFDVEIEGADSKSIKPRLILHDKNYSLCFEGTLKNKKCIFNIPKLQNVIQYESVQSDIEVIFNNKFYKPWTNVIDIEKPVIFNVKESKEPTVKKEEFEPIKFKNPSNIKQKPKSIFKQNANPKAKRLVIEFIKKFNSFNKADKKKMINVINKSHAIVERKWVAWGKQIFEDVKTPQANFILKAFSILNTSKK